MNTSVYVPECTLENWVMESPRTMVFIFCWKRFWTTPSTNLSWGLARPSRWKFRTVRSLFVIMDVVYRWERLLMLYLKSIPGRSTTAKHLRNRWVWMESGPKRLMRCLQNLLFKPSATERPSAQNSNTGSWQKTMLLLRPVNVKEPKWPSVRIQRSLWITATFSNTSRRCSGITPTWILDWRCIWTVRNSTARMV